MDKEYTIQKGYVVDGLGRKLYPTSLDELVPGGNVNLKPYAKKTEVKKDINKATDEIAKDYPDNSELAEALEEYTKKSEVDGIVQDKVDAAIEDLDIEKYIDEEEIAEKIEELALDSYAKKTELNEVDITAQNALTKANNVEELLNGSFTDRIVNVENDIVGINSRLSDDESRIDSVEGSLGDVQSEAGAAFEKASEVESTVSDLENRLEEDYATKAELEALDAAIANELDGCYSYTDDKFDDASGRLNDLQEVVVDGTSEKRSVLDRLDHFIEADAGSIEVEVQNMANQISDAFGDVNQSLTTVSQWLTRITTEDLPKIDTKLAKSDSYDLEFENWFKGETNESEQSHEIDPYANPVWEYKFWPSFRPASNGFVLDNKADQLLKVSDDENKSFSMPFTYDGKDLVANFYNAEGPDNVGYAVTVDWSPIADQTQWLTKLDLDISALVSSVGEHGAESKVSDMFKGAVLQVVNESGSEDVDYLKKSDAYDIDKKVFISGTAMHETDDRYTIAPLYEPQPGMMLAGDDFGEIIRVDEDKNIPDAELYYAGASHGIPLNYDEDNHQYWFNAKDISEFPEELELGDVYVYLSSDGEFDYSKMLSEKYFASLAYAVADPIISLQNAVQELSDGMGQWITALNQEISGLKERVAALERKVLVKYFTRVEADGINSGFILYSGDMTENIIIQHIFINGVLDNDSLISYHDGYTYLDVRQENPRYSGNYEPVVLDAGDLVTVEFYRWEN